MPYIHITCNQPLDTIACEQLRESFSQAVTLLPGKNKNNAMIRIEPNCFMEMGETGQPCAGIEVRLYKQSPQEAKQAFTKKACELMEQACSVPCGRTYVMFIELPQWGMNGQLKG